MILTAAVPGPRTAGCVLRRVAAVDTYVPLAAAANLVLVQEPDIEPRRWPSARRSVR
jgi:hypothetical protein